MVSAFLCVTFLILNICSLFDAKTAKRLLLNDPDALLHRMEMLEAKVQDLTRQLNEEKINSHGQTAGTSYAATGGSANPLCMIHEVLWENHQTEGNMAVLRGAEYQDNFWGTGSLDKDVPCAVCKPAHSSVLMIPGRNKCLPGWTEEYHGYLSGNLDGHKHTSTYICVDENVSFLDSGVENNEYSYLIYGVKAQCGSLKCPPYVNGKPITCVVCSQ
ncbi:unnamed protein product [Mytilus edulis]|uniref:Short-chain collagen C4-like n=1 Tax=Mytilus edulis TaxID=6550 RepID=A0A8S3S578_MYTED|nr:unnamed protein product [Mytilus edulis]